MPEDIVEKFKRIREAAGLSLSDAARIVHIRAARLRAIEAGAEAKEYELGMLKGYIEWVEREVSSESQSIW